MENVSIIVFPLDSVRKKENDKLRFKRPAVIAFNGNGRLS